LPSIQNSPIFKNEANLFDEEKLKEYIANMQDDAQSGDNTAWMNWLATEQSIKQNLERQAYTSLVAAGLGASLEEGEREYYFNNTKMDVQFVYVPYTSIEDDLAKVSNDEINDYVKKNKAKYKPEATRSLKYVKFDIVPSVEDETETKNIVASFINDREEYSSAVKNTISVKGLKNATDYEAFFLENKSDLDLNNGYKYKSQLFAEVADELFNAEIGTVVGPYKENGYYKISKLVETIQLPDSVQSSHILIPYAGATRSTSLKTKEEAKKAADSIYSLVRNNKAKFTEIADEINTDGTKGKGGDIGYVRKDQAFSPAFDKDFADFIYKNKIGSIDVVETAFGYHVIRIDDQKNTEKAVRLATFARIIEASEVTENNIFETAETFASKLVDGNNIDDLGTELNYDVKSAVNLKVLDENIPGLNNQRQIVNWAFNEVTEVGNSKRFDIEVGGVRGYTVVLLDNKTDDKAVAVSANMLTEIKPKLMNKKKSAIISKTLNGSTLEEIAKNAGVTVRNASSVTLASPLITGVGNEPAVVGAISTLPENEVSDIIEGDKGVFVVKVTKRDLPVDLENYETFRKRIQTQLNGRSFQIFSVLQETAEINDNRGKFF
jgi:peptidylprolyl isomerase/peptidyl-prolyl cis-trans isomerase D